MKADLTMTQQTPTQQQSSMIPGSEAAAQYGAFVPLQPALTNTIETNTQQSKLGSIAWQKNYINYLYGNSWRKYFSRIWWKYQSELLRQKFRMWKRARFVRTKLYCPDCLDVIRDVDSQDPSICVRKFKPNISMEDNANTLALCAICIGPETSVGAVPGP